MFVWTQNFATDLLLGGNGDAGALNSEGKETMFWDIYGSWDYNFCDQYEPSCEGEYEDHRELNSIQHPEEI